MAPTAGAPAADHRRLRRPDAAVSPDGARIAFASDRGAPTGRTCGRSPPTVRPAPAAHRSGDDLSPQYSADGQSRGPGYQRLRRLRHRLPDRRRRAALRRDLDHRPQRARPDRAGDPADLVRLAYAQSDPADPGPSDIFTAYSNDGTDEFPLAVDPARSERSPAFSPDSTEVVYVADGGLVVAAAGGAVPGTLPTGQPSAAADPDWAVGEAVDRAPPRDDDHQGAEAEDRSGRRRGFASGRASPARASACRLDRQPARSRATHRGATRASWTAATDSASPRLTPPATPTPRRPGSGFGSTPSPR